MKVERAGRVVGLGLMLSVLGCGGKAADDSRPAQPLYSAPRATPTSPPVAAAPRPSQPVPMTAPEQPPSPPRPLPDPIVECCGLAKAAAENVLLANCGQCHGPALTPAQAQDGINFIGDIDQLVVAGLIAPLSSATSRVVVVMRDGSMPPPSTGLPAVTEADIEVVAQYIDNPRFWPDVPPPAVVDAGIETPSVDAGADGG